MFNRINVLNLPPQYTGCIASLQNAKIAQLVERDLAKVEVAGSSPVFRSTPQVFRVLLGLSFLRIKNQNFKIKLCSDGEIGRHAGLKIQ